MILCSCLGITEDDYKEIYTDWLFNRNSNDNDRYILENAGQVCESCQETVKQIEDRIKQLYE